VSGIKKQMMIKMLKAIMMAQPNMAIIFVSKLKTDHNIFLFLLLNFDYFIREMKFVSLTNVCDDILPPGGNCDCKSQRQ
jgi:hypothetical protein